MDVDTDKRSKVIKDEAMSDDDVTVLEDHEVSKLPKESSSQAKVDATSKATPAESRARSHVQPLHISHDTQQTSPQVLEYIMQDDAENDSTPGNLAGGSGQAYLDTDGVMPSFPTNLSMDANASGSGGMDPQSWLSWQRDAEVQRSTSETHTPRRGMSRGRKFQCGICGTSFTLLKNAKRHYRVQHLNHYFWCKYCPNGKEMRKYTRRVFLEDHFLSHHPDVDCEVEEVTNEIPNEEYNIVSVDIYDDEDEELSTDLVTTTDTNLQGGAVTLVECPRGPFQSMVSLHPDAQLKTGSCDRLSEGQHYINLAEYHGFTSDCGYHTTTSSSRSSSKRSQHSTSPVGQPTKLSRFEQRKNNGSIEIDRCGSEELHFLVEDDSSSHSGGWASHSINNPPQVAASSGGSAPSVSHPTTASPKTKVQSSRPREPYNHSIHRASSEPSHNCLVIGSAILNSSQCDRASEKFVQKTATSDVDNVPSGSIDGQQLSNSSAKSASNKPQSVADTLKQHIQNVLRRKQEVYAENSLEKCTHSVEGDRNVVHSSSDATHKLAKHRNVSMPTEEHVRKKRDTNISAAFSCKYILENHRDHIKRYSKEIVHKYDTSGQVVRRKTIRHIFHFHNTPDQRSENGESQIPDRSASR